MRANKVVGFDGDGALHLKDTAAVLNIKGADLPSAATIDLGGATGDFVDIADSETITGATTAPAGRTIRVRFTGAPLLTHNATSFILTGGANIQAAPGDTATFLSLGGGNWLMFDYGGAVANTMLADMAQNTFKGRVSAGTGDPENLSASQARAILAVAHEITHTWAVPGDIKVPAGDVDYIVPFFVRVPAGQTAKLTQARHRINSGTSVTAKLQINGADATGFTGMSVTTTSTTTNPADISLADGDLVALVVTAISGTPKNMTVSAGIEYARVS
jgi:hypothetical protein